MFSRFRGGPGAVCSPLNSFIAFLDGPSMLSFFYSLSLFSHAPLLSLCNCPYFTESRVLCGKSDLGITFRPPDQVHPQLIALIELKRPGYPLKKFLPQFFAETISSALNSNDTNDWKQWCSMDCTSAGPLNLLLSDSGCIRACVTENKKIAVSSVFFLRPSHSFHLCLSFDVLQ